MENLIEHELVPKHVKMTEHEVTKLLEFFNIGVKQLPKISIKDPIVKQLGAKVGEIIKIARKSPTIGMSFYYRLVIDG